jgi:hypothetical protein
VKCEDNGSEIGPATSNTCRFLPIDVSGGKTSCFVARSYFSVQ